MSSTEEPPAKKQVFVISPIGPDRSPARLHSDLFLSHIVRVAFPESEYEVRRADEDDSPYAITEAMLGRILEADICVADITGLNPNVMYELALAHAADKKVIVMTSDDGLPPFDIKDFRKIKYGLRVDEAQVAVQQLKEKAGHTPAESAFETMLNPVASAFREWTDRQKIDSEDGGANSAVVRLIDRLEQKVDNLFGVSQLSAHGGIYADAAKDFLEDDLNTVEYYLRELDSVRENFPSSTNWRGPNPAEVLIQNGMVLRGDLRRNLPVGPDKIEGWKSAALGLLSAVDM